MTQLSTRTETSSAAELAELRDSVRDFLAAKSVGVTVEEFAFGFGPKLLTLMKRGGTEYTVRALPLGGFVSMIGMQPERDPRREPEVDR